MSVEGGSVGGVGGGVAGAPVVVNEGPFRGSLEGFKPMNASDINTIDFKGGTIAPSQPAVIQQAEEVAGAAWEKSELPAISEATIVPNVIPAWMPDQLVQPLVIPQILPITSTIVEDNDFLAVNPLLEPVAKTELSSKTGTRVFNQISKAVLPQPLLQEQEQEVEEEVLESVKVDEPKDNLEEEEEIEKTNKKFVVDERALSQVVLEIKAAIRKAGVLAGKLGIKITGKLIGSFLPVQHPGNESEAVKGKGPDGSIPERQQTIEEQGEYISVFQAEENAVKVAYEKPPIKIRPEGESVKDEVVEIVFRGHVAKPKTVAVEIIRKRFVKKQVQVPIGQVPAEAKTETSLEDYPELEEVFGRAA